MDRRLVAGLALAAGLTVAACTEQPQDQGMQGPSSVANVAISCTPNSFNSLINEYFVNGSAQWDLVRGYRDAMLATTDLGVARTNGFNILREIALRSKATPQPSPSAGSALAVETLECIFDVTDEENVIKPKLTSADHFSAALNRTSGGVFEVRGGLDDPTGPVQAVVSNAVIAGIAPPQSGAPPQTGTWDASLNNPQRVLFFGDPASTSSDYHFSVVPRAASFDPALVVTTCVNDVDFNDPTLMLTESDVGILAFVDATYIGCGLPPVASVGRFDLLRHLASLGRMLLPQPAVATVLMPGLVGGSAKGVKSVFDTDPVADVVLSVFQPPIPSPQRKNVFFTVKFQATEPNEPGEVAKTVNGTAISVVGVNNNGVPMVLTLDPPGDAPPFECGKSGLPTCTIITTSVGDVHGLAEFVLSSASTGALKLVATGEVVNRDGVVQGTITNKFNVKP
jgi:hypothetical protein